MFLHNFCDGCIDIQATHLNAMKGLEMLHTCNDMIRIFLRFHTSQNSHYLKYLVLKFFDIYINDIDCK